MAVTIEENVLFKEESGGPSQSLYEPFFPRVYLLDIIEIPIESLDDIFFFLDQEYTESGQSLRQIAKKTFSSKEGVRAKLLTYGVPLRAKGQHHGHPAQARFGERVVKGQVRAFKKEQRVVDWVREMREVEGLSLRKIAGRLEGVGALTKERMKGWHAEGVRRVLKYH